MCAVLVGAGCSGTDGGTGGTGTSQAPSSAKLSKEQLWDPCSLPDSVITATGADPSTKDTDPAFGERGDWKLCSWRADGTDGRWGHFMLVASTTRTLDEFRKNTYFHDFSDVKVGDRDAMQFYIGTRKPPTECALASETSKGVVMVKIAKFVDSETSTDPCALAVPAVEQVVGSIPR
ncbi:DUF3558 domain-containing protein [Nocardia goodfellowii]